MLAAVVSLDGILRRLQETSVRGRVVFIVDYNGHMVAYPDTRQFVPGVDALPSSAVVAPSHWTARRDFAPPRRCAGFPRRKAATSRKWSERIARSRT